MLFIIILQELHIQKDLRFFVIIIEEFMKNFSFPKDQISCLY